MLKHGNDDVKCYLFQCCLLLLVVLTRMFPSFGGNWKVTKLATSYAVCSVDIMCASQVLSCSDILWAWDIRSFPLCSQHSALFPQ